MPVTVEGKLELFKKVLFEHIEEEWSGKRNKFQETMEQKLNEKKKEYEKQIKAIKEDGESRAESRRKSVLSKVQGDADYEIMKKKEELFKELTENLINWSREFIKGDKYKAFLQKNIEHSLNVMEGNNLLLSFTDRDISELGSFIREQMNMFGGQRKIELTTGSGDIIGGFTIEDRDSGIMADFSIKTLIDEGKEFMGKLLYEKLDEVLKV